MNSEFRVGFFYSFLLLLQSTCPFVLRCQSKFYSFPSPQICLPQYCLCHLPTDLVWHWNFTQLPVSKCTSCTEIAVCLQVMQDRNIPMQKKTYMLITLWWFMCVNHPKCPRDCFSHLHVNCTQLQIQNKYYIVVLEFTYVLCVAILALIGYQRIHS